MVVDASCPAVPEALPHAFRRSFGPRKKVTNEVSCCRPLSDSHVCGYAKSHACWLLGRHTRAVHSRNVRVSSSDGASWLVDASCTLGVRRGLVTACCTVLSRKL